jgi:hypothetical protein
MGKLSYKQTAVGNIGSLGRDADLRLVPPDCPSNMALSCLRAEPVQLRSLTSPCQLRRLGNPSAGKTK